MMYPISADLWGLLQSQDFDNDSVYLNARDFKLYIGMGNNVPTLLSDSSSSKLAGYICEAKINSITAGHIDVTEISRSRLFTNRG